MALKLSCALLCVVFVSVTLWAQKEAQYRTGRLLKVSSHTYALPDRVGKIQYLLRIQDGANQYFAMYSVNPLFGHDRSDFLKPDSDIQYRISGKSLFVKVQDSKEIKAHLCERVQMAGSPGVKCGDSVISGEDVE